jgi:phospholipase/carboxylesterase
MLHGRSGDEDVMWVFARSLPDDWLIVAPRGPKRDLPTGFAWHPRQRDEWPSLQMFDQAVASVARLIRALHDRYDADPDHIYLLGFSQGAATAYATAMRHPDLVKGIAALVGFVPTDCNDVLSIRPLKGLPVLMIVGKDDPFIPRERSQACAATLRATGTQLVYREYDTGHRLNAEGMRNLKQWWRER